MPAPPIAAGLAVLSRLLFYVMACGVLLATPAIAWEQVAGPLGSVALLGCLAIGSAAGATAFFFRAHLAHGLHTLLAATDKFSPRSSLLAIVACGIVLRLAWAMVFPATTVSDGAVYLKLGQQLAAGEPYFIANSHAFWPPGYPLFLAAWLHLPLPAATIVLLSNLTLYLLASLLVWRLASCAAGQQAARLAAFLLAVWPNYLACAVTAEKENLLVFLLPLVLFLYTHRSAGPLPRIAAGLALGFSALAQPSTMFFPAVLLCYELLQRRPWRAVLAALATLVLGMALVIAPWSARNTRVFGEFLLITSNGGDNLYRANNPLATGGYTRRGEVELDNLGELERNRTGLQLAKEWISSHPAAFVGLIPVKQKLFLGDDSFGQYVTVRSGGGSNRTYLVAKLAANAFWYGLWACLLALSLRGAGPGDAALHSTLVLGYAYFFVLHSVFESSSKYHVPPLALLAIFGAAQLVRASQAGIHQSDSTRSMLREMLMLARYAVIGAVGTGLHYLLLVGLVQGFGTNSGLAAMAGATAGALCNYQLNRRFNFRSTRPHREALPRFLMMAAVGIFLNGLIVGLLHAAGWHYLLAQVFATALILLINYQASKSWIFQPTRT
ncbi:GtrA family protein [Pseudoduganella sp. R-34]|uniref:GtrA family protein n=1 Tax=Pseudoduganella sp. R-34 TaxID=3404062 RepID=UPI003CE6C151